MKASDKAVRGSNGFMTLKVELPPTGIVRMISVPECMTLEDLHEAIQAVMGWEHEHLWNFITGGRDGVIYEVPHGDDFAAFGRRLKMDATKTTLRKVFPKRGAKLTYEYDFGDSWDHVITRMADPKEPEIACLKSEGPDGLEDFGGQWRFAEALKALGENPDSGKNPFQICFKRNQYYKILGDYEKLTTMEYVLQVTVNPNWDGDVYLPLDKSDDSN